MPLSDEPALIGIANPIEHVDLILLFVDAGSRCPRDDARDECEIVRAENRSAVAAPHPLEHL